MLKRVRTMGNKVLKFKTKLNQYSSAFCSFSFKELISIISNAFLKDKTPNSCHINACVVEFYHFKRSLFESRDMDSLKSDKFNEKLLYCVIESRRVIKMTF
jgi:hypothetical protein